MTSISLVGTRFRLLVVAVLIAAALALSTSPVAAGGGRVYAGHHNVPGGIARNITWE